MGKKCFFFDNFSRSSRIYILFVKTSKARFVFLSRENRPILVATKERVSLALRIVLSATTPESFRGWARPQFTSWRAIRVSATGKGKSPHLSQSGDGEIWSVEIQHLGGNIDSGHPRLLRISSICFPRVICRPEIKSVILPVRKQENFPRRFFFLPPLLFPPPGRRGGCHQLNMSCMVQ